MAMMAAMGVGSAKGLIVSLAMVDGPDALSSSHAQLLMVFVGIAALALAGQAVVFIMAAIGAMRAQKRILAIVEEVRGTALPMIQKAHTVMETSHGVMTDLGPHVKEIIENLSDVSHVVRDKVHELEPTVTALNETVNDANRKTAIQVSRVDGMVTTALNATAEIAATIHHGIRVPVRELAGVVSGFKAGIDTLTGRGFSGFKKPRTAPTPPVAEKPVPASAIPMAGPAPNAAPAAAAEARNTQSFAAYRAAMQAKRRDLDL